MSGGVDLALLPFNTYDEYLLSFTTLEDFRYFPDKKSLSQFLKIGYRSTGKIYQPDEFVKMKSKIADFLNPKISSRVLYSSFMKGNDAVLRALAEREEANLNHKLAVSESLDLYWESDHYTYLDIFADHHIPAGASA